MSNPVDRDMARMMRDMRRKLAKEAPRPRPDTEVDDLLTPEAESRLGPLSGLIRLIPDRVAG